MGPLVASQAFVVIEETSLAVAYGPLSVQFRSSDPRVRFFARPAHDRFVVDAVGADCALDWRFGAVQPSATNPPCTVANSWDTRSLADGWEETIFYETPARIPMLALRFDPAFRTASVVQAPLGHGAYRVNVGRYPLDEFVATRLLGRREAVLLHASTAVVDGEAYVFAGHSGAGKSTIASLAEVAGARILSDDRTILTYDDGVVRAWGTPWHGTHRRAERDSAPVRGVLLLSKDSVNVVSSLDPSRALKELFVRLIQPRVSAHEVDNNLRVLAVVLQSVNVGLLRFTPEIAAFRMVLAAYR